MVFMVYTYGLYLWFVFTACMDGLCLGICMNCVYGLFGYMYGLYGYMYGHQVLILCKARFSKRRGLLLHEACLDKRWDLLLHEA